MSHSPRFPGLRRVLRRRDVGVGANGVGVIDVGAVDVGVVDTTVRVGRVELRNPIVAASGTFGHSDELALMCDPTQLGAVTVKSVALFACAGNAAPRLHTSASGMINSVGLQGPGVDVWIDEELPLLRARGARVVASIWGRTREDYAGAARKIAAVADELLALEVNISCPNVEDRSRMFSHDETVTREVITSVVSAVGKLPVWAKLSPNVTSIVDIAGGAIAGGADALTLINTVMGLAVDAERRRPVLGGGGGGLSGPAVKPVALRAVGEVRRAFPEVALIGTGGVSSGIDAVEMMVAGANAVGVGTATFLDPRATIKIRDELVSWCAHRGLRQVAELSSTLIWD